MRRSSGHAAVGTVSLVLGLGLLGLGLARPPFAEGMVLMSPVWSLLAVGGLVLLLSGALVLVFTFRPQPEPPATVPAYVAFSQKMPKPQLVPPPPARPPRPARAATVLSADAAGIDAEIRELTRKINKAGVLLATGQLSQQGYLAYVEDLKRTRGRLEAERVGVELGGR